MTTKTAQFTPGPWYPHLAKADHCLASSVWGAEPGNQVAVIGGKSLETMNANAHLIAAAPAMYEALQIIVRAANVDEIDPLVMFASIERARHVLKLAEGKSA